VKIGTRIVALSLVLGSMVLSGMGTALADDEVSVEGTEVRQDVGPQVEGLTPGIDGYKVFGPEAIESQSAHPEKGYTAPAAATRYAITDIWKTSSGYIHGSHTSESSDLVEDQIWVDGAIRRTTQGWRNSCSMHNAGMIATCHTEMPDANGSQTYEAKSWHHFHKTGYADWNPITNDIMKG